MIAKYRNLDLDELLNAVSRHWDEILAAFRSRHRIAWICCEPMARYQTVACRLWPVPAYRAGGAYGFRDQLRRHGNTFAAGPTEPTCCKPLGYSVAVTSSTWFPIGPWCTRVADTVFRSYRRRRTTW